MKRLLLPLLIFLVHVPRVFALVEFDFDAVAGDGSVGRGYLAFDADAAVREDRDDRLPYFNLPGSMWFTVGQRTFTGGPVNAFAQRGSLEFSDMYAGSDDVSANYNFWLTGNLFDQDPDGDLRGGRWEEARAPEGQIEVSTYGDEPGGFWLRVANFIYRRPSNDDDRLAEAGLGDYDGSRDAAPVPEPSSLALLSAAGIGLAFQRARNSWRSRKRAR